MKNQPPAERPLPYFIDFSALYRRAEAIANAYESGNLVFFLGAGSSKSFNREFPSWAQLLQAVLGEVGSDSPKHGDEIRALIDQGKYLYAAEALKRYANVDRDDRDAVIDRQVAKILNARSQFKGDPILQLAVLDFQAPVVTTNYDTILESVLREHNLDEKVAVFTHEDDKEIATRLDPTEPYSPYIFKLHGSARKGDLILDEGDYADLYFHGRWPRAIALLSHLLATKMVIFVGFSLADPEIMPLLREATRYASSYQHLAFLKEGDVSGVECEILRTHYRVDPILYAEHSQLPFYLLEMRNFHTRDQLSLMLADKSDALNRAAAAIQSDEGLAQDCSVVLFGSHAKYGPWTSDDADYDLFFLSPGEVESKTAQPSEVAQGILDRRVDATIMTRLEFEDLLRQGDAFASSVLVTGCPIVDPLGIYQLLARGFRPQYSSQALAENAHERCQLRWLRLCALRKVEKVNFLRACQQWTLSMMQLVLIQSRVPTSLLEASLLGNARAVIHEFVQRCAKADESFLLDVLRGAKGLPISRPEGWPDIVEAAKLFRSALADRHNDYERDLLLSLGILSKTEPARLAALYAPIETILNNIEFPLNDFSLPDRTEHELRQALTDAEHNAVLSTFDWLLLFKLYDRAHELHLNAANPKLLEIIKELQTEWAAVS